MRMINFYFGHTDFKMSVGLHWFRSPVTIEYKDLE